MSDNLTAPVLTGYEDAAEDDGFVTVVPDVSAKIPAGLQRCGDVDFLPVGPVGEFVGRAVINGLCRDVHADNVAAGWWTDLATGQPKERNVGELLCLVHSEISEAMEGHRKSLMDDKLPHRPMIEVELADACIRIFDLCGAKGYDLGGAIVEKRAFNAQRSDHKIENRMQAGGKAY